MHIAFYQAKHENWMRHVPILKARNNPHAYYAGAFQTNWRRWGQRS